MNMVQLQGNLGANPDIRVFQDGQKAAFLNLATNEYYTDRQTGERKQRTDWHRIAVWNPSIVNVVEAYCKKGSKIQVLGSLHTRKFEKDGQPHYITEVTLRHGAKLFLQDPPPKKDAAAQNEAEQPTAEQIVEDAPF